MHFPGLYDTQHGNLVPDTNPLICETKGLPGRDSRTRGYLVSPTLNHGMKKIDPLKMRRSDLKSVNYCQNCYFCSGKCKEDTAILASVIFH